MSAGMLGRSYARACARSWLAGRLGSVGVVGLGTIVGAGMGSSGGAVPVGGVGKSDGSGGMRVGVGVYEVGGGLILTLHKRAPSFSRTPRRIGLPDESLITMWAASK